MSHNIVDAALDVLEGKVKKGKRPRLWDGKTAERIVAILAGSGVRRQVKRFKGDTMGG